MVDQLPLMGRVLYGAHLALPRPDDPLLSGWHAVNCIREWRGDTHWAVAVAAGLDHAEASILHNAWMDYETDWLANSRGTTPEALEAGWAALEAKGLAADRQVLPGGHRAAPADRGRDRPADHPALGAARRGPLAPVRRGLRAARACSCLERVDLTAGPNYQPASRLRR